MGRAKLHVVPNTEVVAEVPSVASKPAKRATSRAKPASTLVADVMQMDVASCKPYEPLNAVGRLMWERDVGAVVIVDEQLRPLSMVTDRDLAMAAYTQGAPLANITVRSCMSQRLVACSHDTTAAEALQLMQHNRVRRLPVVDTLGKLVGIVGLTDLTKASNNKQLKTGIKVGDVAGALSAILE